MKTNMDPQSIALLPRACLTADLAPWKGGPTCWEEGQGGQQAEKAWAPCLRTAWPAGASPSSASFLAHTERVGTGLNRNLGLFLSSLGDKKK